MLLNSHISAYASCLAGKVCGLVRSTWGTSQGEDKLGARDKILDTKVACRARAGQNPPVDLSTYGHRVFHGHFLHAMPLFCAGLAVCLVFLETPSEG